MAEPRIPPLPESEWTDEQRELLASANADNIFATMARHPQLFRRWLPFAGRLLFRGSLPAREREIVILRVAWGCEAPYEWGQHVAFAREAGLTDDEIMRIARGGAWNDADFALLEAVDELIDDHCISEGTWELLAERFDEEQLIELPLLAGHYIMLAGALNSWAVPVDKGLPRLGELD